jgi:hypothetical protein
MQLVLSDPLRAGQLYFHNHNSAAQKHELQAHCWDRTSQNAKLINTVLVYSDRLWGPTTVVLFSTEKLFSFSVSASRPALGPSLPPNRYRSSPTGQPDGAWSSPLTSIRAEVKKEWRYPSTPTRLPSVEQLLKR